MSYIKGEEALFVLIQGVAGFDGKNTARARWQILNSGDSDHYAILKRGESRTEWVAHRTTEDNYRTIVEVWRQVGVGINRTETDDYDALLEHHDNIRARIKEYRLLADNTNTVFDANYTGSSVVTEQWRQNSDGASWLKIEMFIDWSEQNVVTFSE